MLRAKYFKTRKCGKQTLDVSKVNLKYTVNSIKLVKIYFIRLFFDSKFLFEFKFMGQVSDPGRLEMGCENLKRGTYAHWAQAF